MFINMAYKKIWLISTIMALYMLQYFRSLKFNENKFYNQSNKQYKP